MYINFSSARYFLSLIGGDLKGQAQKNPMLNKKNNYHLNFI